MEKSKRHIRTRGFARYRCARTAAIGYTGRGRRRASHSSESGSAESTQSRLSALIEARSGTPGKAGILR